MSYIDLHRTLRPFKIRDSEPEVHLTRVQSESEAVDSDGHWHAPAWHAHASLRLSEPPAADSESDVIKATRAPAPTRSHSGLRLAQMILSSKPRAGFGARACSGCRPATVVVVTVTVTGGQAGLGPAFRVRRPRPGPGPSSDHASAVARATGSIKEQARCHWQAPKSRQPPA